jgi:hypothetical protein
MNARIFEFPENQKWQALYKAAIVEADSTKLPDRIAEAKRVMGQRARELFQTAGNNFEEEQALDAAICVLHALHGTLKSRPIAVQPIRNDLKTGTS